MSVRRHKIDVGAYHRMAEVGIFEVGARVELIDGEIFDMAPVGQDHAGATNWLVEFFILALAGRAIVSAQNPVRLDARTEPQPDVSVLRRRADFYRSGAPPGPGDVILLVEVSDSTLAYDRDVKLSVYARAGIAESWVVDLQHRLVLVGREPGPAGYATVTAHGSGQAIALASMPDVVLDIERLLGAAAA